MRKNLRAYNQVNIESSLLAANPHQIILMMYDGLLESIAKGKGAIERNDLETKSKMLTKAVNILAALENSLDAKAEPEISKNFSALYGYCIDKLNEISISMDTNGLDQVIEFLKPLRDAWKDMPEASKQEGIELLKQKDQQPTITAAV